MVALPFMNIPMVTDSDNNINKSYDILFNVNEVQLVFEHNGQLTPTFSTAGNHVFKRLAKGSTGQQTSPTRMSEGFEQASDYSSRESEDGCALCGGIVSHSIV